MLSQSIQLQSLILKIISVCPGFHQNVFGMMQRTTTENIKKCIVYTCTTI